MSHWDAEVLSLRDQSDLRYQALRRIRRQQSLRRKTLGTALGAVAGAGIAIAVSYYARDPVLGVILLLLSTASFLVIYLFDLYLLNQDERQDRRLAAEVEREVEHLREPPTKLKRGQLYRLNDDDELEEVDPVEMRLHELEFDREER